MTGAGRRLYALACQLDLEGIVAKSANSRYENPSGRSWIKPDLQPEGRARRRRNEMKVRLRPLVLEAFPWTADPAQEGDHRQSAVGGRVLQRRLRVRPVRARAKRRRL